MGRIELLVATLVLATTWFRRRRRGGGERQQLGGEHVNTAAKRNMPGLSEEQASTAKLDDVLDPSEKQASITEPNISDTSEEEQASTAEPNVSDLSEKQASTGQRNIPGPREELIYWEDPWWIATSKNKADSPLCRLPNELIVEVMERLPATSMYHFRQTCRLFMQLFEYRGQLRETMKHEVYPHMLRPQEERLGGGGQQYPCDEIKRAVRRVLFCEPCLRFRESGTRDVVVAALKDQKIYCCGCRATHPAIFFSREQREDVPASQRVCIGRQGHVRLCQHKVLRWSDVSHAQRFHRSWQPTLSVLRCTHCSHDVNPAQASQMGAQSSDRADESSYPKAVLVSQPGQTATWKTPIKLRLDGQLAAFAVPEQRGKQPTMDELHSLLKNAAAATAAASASLCPHESLGSLSILRAFDPNHCVCLSAQVGLCSFYHDRTTRHYYDRQMKCQVFRHHHEYEDLGVFLPSWPPCTKRERQSGISCEVCEGRNWVQHQSACTDCATWYTWSRQGDYVKLRRSSKATVVTPLDAEWLRLLDKDSFDCEDAVTRHLLWCSDPGCALSRRGRSWAAFLVSTLGIKYEPKNLPDMVEERYSDI